MATITGSDKSEFISGTDGDDIINGGGGNDFVSAGDGDDEIYHVLGFGTSLGGPGDDTFKAVSPSAGVVVNPPTDDVVVNPIGIPPGMFGGPGFDTIDASGALQGLSFSEAVFSGFSVEELIGSPFNDEVDATGSEADLILNGGEGDDVLIGGLGDDQINGGAGSDQLTGGGGSNIFGITELTDSPFDKPDVITDFNLDAVLNGAETDAPDSMPSNGSELESTADVPEAERTVDVIDGPFAVEAGAIKAAGTVETLDPENIEGILTEETLPSMGAATFTIEESLTDETVPSLGSTTSTSEERTFLALNDEVAGFQAATDAVIEITGYSGNLADMVII
mgnify:CR=1 FL=1